VRYKYSGIILLGLSVFLYTSLKSPKNIFSEYNGLWTQTLSYPRLITSHTSATIGNKIFVFAGAGSFIHGVDNVANSTNVFGGQISGWNFEGNAKLTDFLIGHSMVLDGNKVYILGGAHEDCPACDIAQDNVYIGYFNNEGLLDKWIETEKIPLPISLGGAGKVKDKIYSIAGESWINGSSHSVLSKVNMATVSAEGNLTPWVATTPLPEPREGLQVVTTDTDLYAIGGRWNEVAKSNVYRAIFDGDGLITRWESQPSLPSSTYRPQVVISGKYIFVFGGHRESVGNLRDVFYTEIKPDGNLSDWVIGGEEMKLSKPTYAGTVVALGGYFYLIGGVNSNYTAEVYSMKIPDFALPTPIPTPTFTPLVFLPGMMASWNKSLLHFGENVPNEEWKIAPYVNNYDNFFGSLEKAGYEINKDYFVYAYDWRKPIASNASDLADYIDNTVGTKVNLVGHSMGGLIARTYAYNNKDKINVLVTVGSPHKGSAKAYYPWEGADLTGLSNTEKIALRLYLRAISDVFTNDVETIHKEVPSLKEILPVENYLKKRDGSLILVTDMKQQNSFLAALNSLEQNKLPETVTIYGSGVDTWKFLTVVNRTSWDKVWDKWEDGKPIGFASESGDETVLAVSSILPTPAIQKDAGYLLHDDLLSGISGQKTVFDALGLSEVNFEISDPLKYKRAVVAAMGSAATFEIKDPQGNTYTPFDNVLAIDQAASGSYTLKILPDGVGKYTLYLGRLLGDDEAWEEFSGTSEARLIQFNVNWDNPNLGTDPIARAKTKINNLKVLINEGRLNKGNINAFTTQLGLIEKEINDLSNANENRQAWIISFTDGLVKRIQTDWKGADENYKQTIIGILRKMKLDVAEAVDNLLVD